MLDFIAEEDLARGLIEFEVYARRVGGPCDWDPFEDRSGCVRVFRVRAVGLYHACMVVFETAVYDVAAVCLPGERDVLIVGRVLRGRVDVGGEGPVLTVLETVMRRPEATLTQRSMLEVRRRGFPMIAFAGRDWVRVGLGVPFDGPEAYEEDAYRIIRRRRCAMRPAPDGTDRHWSDEEIGDELRRLGWEAVLP
jgi:hypothetical protein